MLPYHVAVILGYSIAIAAVIGLIRFGKILPANQPFVFILWFGLLNHTLSVFFIHFFGNNSVNSNIYVLAESLLYLWLFRNWGSLGKKETFFRVLIFLLVVSWMIDNLVWHKITVVNSFFRILYSFLLIFLSIEQLNKLITSARKNLLFNSTFLICIGVLIYFSYKATIEVFFFIKLKASDRFYINIFVILVFVNFFVNLIFAWATLWIPRKQKFISQH